MKIKDIIYREDAINLCEKWRNRTNEHHDKNGWYIADTLLKAIKELPSADRPQGEWIADKHKSIWDMDVDCYRCSNCGSRAINHSLIMDITGLSYCPNCGARMKGADDEKGH